MFVNMTSCDSIEVGDFNEATSTSGMFSHMQVCKSIIVGDFKKSTNTSYMFMATDSCRYISCGEYGSSTRTNRMFGYMKSCKSFNLTKYNNSIDLEFSDLSTESFIDLFNKLEVVENKTLKISNSVGASALVDADISIATNKGWTVIR